MCVWGGGGGGGGGGDGASVCEERCVWRGVVCSRFISSLF